MHKLLECVLEMTFSYNMINLIRLFVINYNFYFYNFDSGLVSQL